MIRFTFRVLHHIALPLVSGRALLFASGVSNNSPPEVEARLLVSLRSNELRRSSWARAYVEISSQFRRFAPYNSPRLHQITA